MGVGIIFDYNNPNSNKKRQGGDEVNLNKQKGHFLFS
jgi:hypothetical protein